MDLFDVFKVTSAIIASLGGGGLLVFCLSSWLGKVWANRIMEADRAKHAQDLEALRANLHHQSQQFLTDLTTDLEIFRDKHLKLHHDKLAIYRNIVDIVSDILASVSVALIANQPVSPESLVKFNRERMKAYGYLAMIAPQPVMDAYDRLIDHLFAVINAEKLYIWPEIRALAIDALNQMRVDIGLDKTSIEYRGNR